MDLLEKKKKTEPLKLMTTCTDVDGKMSGAVLTGAQAKANAQHLPNFDDIG